MSSSTETPSSFKTQLQTPKASPADQEFFNHARPASINELKSSKQEETFIVYATVNNIAGEGSWWYPACRCNKKVYADEGVYFCEKCNKHVVTVTPRYLLRLRVVDDSDSTIFVLFDREAATLLGQSCAELIEAAESGGDFNIPKQISALIGKSLLFKVQSEAPTDAKWERTFRVRGVGTGDALLKKFKEKTTTEVDVPNAHNPSTSNAQTKPTEVEHTENASTVVGAQSITDVSQDLITKFTESQAGGGNIESHPDIVDLSNESDITSDNKRSSPSVTDPGVANGVVLKKIKIEKE